MKKIKPLSKRTLAEGKRIYLDQQLATWKATGVHPSVQHAKELFPDLGAMILYEKGRTPKRRTVQGGRCWRYTLLPDGKWACYEQAHHRQPRNGRRPVLVGWSKVTNQPLFLWNL